MALINTTLCYLEKNDRYLMLHRVKKQNDCNKDKWIGVGGKFETGESPEECVAREVLEETGFVLKSAEYRGIVTFVSREKGKEPYYELMHLFWSGAFERKECKEGQTLMSDNKRGQTSLDFLPECDEGNLEWVLKSRMNELPHWKGDEIFLDLLNKKVPFFSLKLEYEEGTLVNAALDGKKISF